MRELPRLITERLILRPFEAADGPVVERLAGSREVADTTLTIPHPYPVGGGAQWIATHAAAWERGNNIALAVCDKLLTRELLGTVSLQVSAAHAHGEIGYLKLHRVQGRHFTRNAASGRVLQKLGMQYEGTHRDAYRRWDRFEDVAVYAVLAPEWSLASNPSRAECG